MSDYENQPTSNSDTNATAISEISGQAKIATGLDGEALAGVGPTGEYAVHYRAIHSLTDGNTAIDRFLLKWSSWLNPILVKESRQAFKGKQFNWTFGLLLLAIAGWTMLMISLSMPGVYYLSTGLTLLSGYIVGLVFPTCIVVPITAFRSMSAELEEGTYEVLSVSSVRGRQIVVGKILVALIQNVVFFSALAPCIALTYLLRGVSLILLSYILPMTFFIALFMAVVGVLFATLARSRFGQSMLFIALAILLLIVAGYWIGGSLAMMQNTNSSLTELWIATLVGWAFMFAYGWLFVLVASARLSFSSENHITGIMEWSIMIYALIVVTFILVYRIVDDEVERFEEVWSAPAVIGIIHLSLSGIFAMAQSGLVSQRARRELPYSLGTRLLFSWFNPGSGPSYVLHSLAAFSLPLFVTIAAFARPEFYRVLLSTTFNLMLFLACYLTFYLGLLRLLMMMFGRFSRQRSMLAVSLGILLVVVGSLGPVFLSYCMNNFRDYDYEVFSFTNPFWVSVRVINGESIFASTFVALPLCAAVVFLINLFQLTRDVLLVRAIVPSRVKEELQLDANKVATEATNDPFAD